MNEHMHYEYSGFQRTIVTVNPTNKSAGLVSEIVPGHAVFV
jgi:hypothetical protein